MDTPENLPDLQYPWWRDELIAHLEELVDREYQERQWVRREVIDPNHMEGFEFAIDALDDSGFFDKPMQAVGVSIYDETEATAMAGVAAAVDAVLAAVHDKKGAGPHEDAVYLRSPLWPAVVSAAVEAVRLLRERPTKYPPPGIDPYADAQRIAYRERDAERGLSS